jgi:RNA polymerase sigma-70 factor, ECF subfamily
MIKTSNSPTNFSTVLEWICPSGDSHQADENHLIQAAQRGSLEAFNQLVLNYQDLVYRQAFWMLGEQEAAEDATQEAFIRAYQNIHTVYGNTFKAWLLRIVTNCCIDMLRRLQKHPLTSLEPVDQDGEEFESSSWLVDPNPSIESRVESEEMMRAVRNCLDQLHPDYRTAVILVDVQELDYLEASKIMGLGMGTFKSRLARARLRLRNALQNYWGGGYSSFATAC